MVNIQNIDDNKRFKWSIVRCLHPKRIKKADKDFAENLGIKDIKCPVKVWDIHITGKKNSICTSAFSYKSKEKHEIYVSKKCCEEKHVDLLLIGEEGKRHQVLIKDFNTLMHDHTLDRGKNYFCRFTSFQYRRNIKASY